MKHTHLSNLGKEFVRNIKTCLDWLALGGELQTDVGLLAMDEEGNVGYVMHTYKNGKMVEKNLFGTAGDGFGILLRHAGEMRPEQRMRLAADITLTQTKSWSSLRT